MRERFRHARRRDCLYASLSAPSFPSSCPPPRQRRAPFAARLPAAAPRDAPRDALRSRDYAGRQQKERATLRRHARRCSRTAPCRTKRSGERAFFTIARGIQDALLPAAAAHACALTPRAAMLRDARKRAECASEDTSVSLLLMLMRGGFCFMPPAAAHARYAPFAHVLHHAYVSDARSLCLTPVRQQPPRDAAQREAWRWCAARECARRRPLTS